MKRQESLSLRRRKNTSVKKLEEERQNLLRVNDILARVGETDRTTGTTVGEGKRIFEEERETLKTYDINMFLLETERLKDLSGQVEDKLKLT